MATTYHVTQSGAGSHNGSVGNEWSVSDFNTVGNWSGTPGTSGKISPGDTVSLEGTISTGLVFKGGGTAGNVITLLFAPSAIMTTTVWPSFAITISSLNYITIDGGATGTIGGVNGNSSFINGIIESTANGTALANQLPNAGIVAANSSHLTIKNIVIRKMYQRTQNATSIGNETSTVGIENLGSSSVFTDFAVDNCIISDAYIGLNTDYGSGAGSANYSFTNCTYDSCNWEIHVGGRNNTSELTNLTVAYNIFGNYLPWDDPADNYHHNGCFIAPQDTAGTGFQHNVRVYRNKFNDGYGAHSTSAIFMNAFASDWNVVIYDNIFFCPVDTPSNSLITLAMYSGTMTVTNNSVYAASGSGSSLVTVSGAQGVSSVKTYNVYNNAAYNIMLMYYHDANAFTTLNEDNNCVAGTTFSGFYYQFEGATKTLTEWRALGYDANGTNSNPLFISSTNLHLQAGSPCIGTGVSQSTNYTTDFDGVTWSSWGMGAYMFVSGVVLTLKRLGRNIRFKGLSS